MPPMNCDEILIFADTTNSFESDFHARSGHEVEVIGLTDDRLRRSVT